MFPAHDPVRVDPRLVRRHPMQCGFAAGAQFLQPDGQAGGRSGVTDAGGRATQVVDRFASDAAV